MTSVVKIAKSLGVDTKYVYENARVEAGKEMYKRIFSYDSIERKKQKQDLINEVYIEMLKDEINKCVRNAGF